MEGGVNLEVWSWKREMVYSRGEESLLDGGLGVAFLICGNCSYEQ